MASNGIPDKPQSTVEEIKASIGDISSLTVYGPQILLGIFMKGTTKDLGGGKTLYIPEKSADEDRWQNKLGCILKKGPLAFVPDGQHEFGGLDPSEGEWVLCRTSDGMPLDIHGVHCRLVEDTNIKMSVIDPTAIW